MIVDGSFTLQGPREVVWDLLHDPDVLVKTLPGGERLTRGDGDTYEGVMRVGVGPVTAARFSVTVQLRDKVPPERLHMDVDGRGGIGFTRGTAAVELVEQPGGATVIKYRAELQIGGRIAAVGQRLLDAAARHMTRAGLEALNRELQARLSGGAA
ncbi:MAG: CoxG family protein [Gemmatimonadales bacterium]